MVPRIDWIKAVPEVYKTYAALEQYLATTGLEKKFLELIKLRASQINHCAYCIDMHSKALRAAGESDQRLFGLSAWQESPFFTDRERAALAWAEALTRLTDGFVTDDIYGQVRPHFSEQELVKLTMAIVTINGWNRFCVSFRTPPAK